MDTPENKIQEKANAAIRKLTAQDMQALKEEVHKVAHTKRVAGTGKNQARDNFTITMAQATTCLRALSSTVEALKDYQFFPKLDFIRLSVFITTSLNMAQMLMEMNKKLSLTRPGYLIADKYMVGIRDLAALEWNTLIEKFDLLEEKKPQEENVPTA